MSSAPEIILSATIFKIFNETNPDECFIGSCHKITIQQQLHKYKTDYNRWTKNSEEYKKQRHPAIFLLLKKYNSDLKIEPLEVITNCTKYELKAKTNDIMLDYEKRVNFFLKKKQEIVKKKNQN